MLPGKSSSASRLGMSCVKGSGESSRRTAACLLRLRGLRSSGWIEFWTKRRSGLVLGADGLCVANGRQIEFLIPIEKFAFIGDERHHLSPREMDVKELLRVADEFFHS